MSPGVLEVRNLRKRYGELAVTDGVSLDVEAGTIHALIGPNGAGKSTLIGQITGEITPDAGSIAFDGKALNDWPVHRRAQAGLVRAYQVPQYFPSFSVADNVAISWIARTRRSWRWLRMAGADKTLSDGIRATLDASPLAELAQRRAADLAHGEKRQLELVMALATEPRLLLLDEPLAGLGPGDSERMIEWLRSLKGRYSMLLVEHDMKAVFALSDRISVLVAGRIIASGDPPSILRDPRVRSAYLGEPA